MKKMLSVLLSALGTFARALWREVTGEDETPRPVDAPKLGAPPGFKPVKWDDAEHQT